MIEPKPTLASLPAHDAGARASDGASRHRIPLWIKGLYTLFVLVVIPVYWPTYGPANFLWFCDTALLITVAALWLESPLLASTQALAIALPQAVWVIDFLSGGRLLGISAYMFKADIPMHVRALSTFHIWLPVLLLWMVWRLGYDRRALWMQTGIAIALLLASYLQTDPRRPPAGYPDAAVNVNRVFGPKEADVQHWMPPLLYLTINIAFWVVCFYIPTHLAFRRMMPPRATRSLAGQSTPS